MNDTYRFPIWYYSIPRKTYIRTHQVVKLSTKKIIKENKLCYEYCIIYFEEGFGPTTRYTLDLEYSLQLIETIILQKLNLAKEHLLSNYEQTKSEEIKGELWYLIQLLDKVEEDKYWLDSFKLL